MTFAGTAAARFFEALRRRLRLFPLELRRAVRRRGFFALVAGAFLCGLLLSAACSYLMPAVGAGIAPGTVASSFILVLVFVGFAPCFFPLPLRRPEDRAAPQWAGTTGWLKVVFLALAAWSGRRWGTTTPEPWAVTWVFVWLCLAYVALLIGLAAVLTRLWPARPQFGRMLVALLTAAAVTGLFWGRPVFLEIAAAEESDAAKLLAPTTTESAARTAGPTGRFSERFAEDLMCLNPVFAAAAAWRTSGDGDDGDDGDDGGDGGGSERVEGGAAGFDLVHARYTYNFWLGSDTPLAYPRLLPERERSGVDFFEAQAGGAGDEADSRGSWRAGLLLKLLAWGLGLMILADLFPRHVRDKRNRSS